MSLIRFNVESNPTRPIRPSPLTASTIRDMPLDLVDRIRSFPLFVSASEDFLAAIGNHLRPQVHAAHDHILTEGDEAKAMYWLVRGVVAVTSRDGEAVFAELKAGAFFGEIGVLMDMPRTATIVARTKCLVVVLKKEDLQAELPKFPDMEKAIRQEARERLNILTKKRAERHGSLGAPFKNNYSVREPAPGEVATGDVGVIREGTVVNTKKRKSPSPGVIEDPAAGSALGSGIVNVRKTLKELPLFSTLPPDILHFLGLSAQPKTYAPFSDIIRQGTPGNEIYFIVRGEAEVIHELPNGQGAESLRQKTFYQRPRLRQGQYFGEVASLGMSPGRTATVRAITTVECLMIGGEALDELWRRCPPDIKSQVIETAKERYRKSTDDSRDVVMTDADRKEDDEAAVGRGSRRDPGHGDGASPARAASLPRVTFTTPSKPTSPSKINDTRGHSDPDPFLSVDMENLRNRRRNSLAPPTPGATQTDASAAANGMRSPLAESTPIGPAPASSPAPSPVKFSNVNPFQFQSSPDEAPPKRAKIRRQRPDADAKEEVLPDKILIEVLRHLDVVELMRLRLVSTQWRAMVATSDKLCKHVDLTPYSRLVTDAILSNILAPFIGNRPESIDISNCFHLTDDGFAALWRSCGANVKAWRMRSVWEVSANQILEMSENAKGLEEVDWSNCRKVGDNLLARVVGWVVPELPPVKHVVIAPGGRRPPPQKLPAHQHNQQAPQQGQGQQVPVRPPPGTVIGCSKLKHLNLSYCKHITDRSMAHLAVHACSRIESLSLTRCTSITDAGFQAWASYRFANLSHLCLADCTYLSDNAIVSLTNAAKNLTHLDLSFCCALTDTSTEVVALTLPKLKELRLAFCGSAVSDGSLRCIALHLNELEGLSVRGCVRVTGQGVESVLEGCGMIRWLDGSQCKNLEPWVAAGGVTRWGYDERGGERADLKAKAAAEMMGLKERVTATPFRGFSRRRAKGPVRFILEKGTSGLR